MSSLPVTYAEDVIHEPPRTQFEVFLDDHRGFEVFLDDHRAQLNGCLEALTEQARGSLVPSLTTLFALVSTQPSSRRSGSRRPSRAGRVLRSASPLRQTSRTSSMTTTPSPPSSQPTARHASHHDARPRRSRWTTRSMATGADHHRRVGCTCMCCVSSHSTADTPTSCVSSCHRVARAGVLPPRFAPTPNASEADP